MEKDMALKWEKVKVKDQARVVSNFKKKWIPFVLEFAQANLRKVNKAKLSSYRKGMAFLASPFAERFDEDGFENYWRSGGYEKENMEIDDNVMKILLGRFQSRFQWISKYMGRKDKTDARKLILHHVITTSALYINREWQKDNFSLEHHLYPAKQNESAQQINQAVFFFMRLLDGLPVSSIKKCIGCGHYFLHLTKRERGYCTPSCAGRSIQKEKREELKKHQNEYDRFLLEQKFRMGELRLGPKKYSAYLRENDKKHLRAYERWTKLREKTKRPRPKKRGSKRVPRIF